jgi:hypothetical protein
MRGFGAVTADTVRIPDTGARHAHAQDGSSAVQFDRERDALSPNFAIFT